MSPLCGRLFGLEKVCNFSIAGGLGRRMKTGTTAFGLLFPFLVFLNAHGLQQ